MPRFTVKTDAGDFTITPEMDGGSFTPRAQVEFPNMGKSVIHLDTAPSSLEEWADIASQTMASTSQPIKADVTGGMVPQVTGEDVRAGLELAGSIAGGAVMPQLGPAAGGFVSRIATGATNALLRAGGSAVGAGAGSLATEPVAPSKNPLETAAGAALAGGVGELAAAPFFSATKRLRSGVPGITAAGREASQVLGGKVLPAEVTNSFLEDVLQNVSEASFTGGGAIAAFKREREGIIRQLADDAAIVAGRRATTDDAGKAFLTRLEDRMALWGSRVKQLYSAVDDVASWPVGQPLPVNATPNARFVLRKNESGQFTTTVGVNSEPLKVFARQELDRLGGTPTAVSSGRKSILDDLLEMPDTLTFAQAHELRSSMLARERTLTTPDNKKAKALASLVAGKTDGAMEAAARETGLPELMQAYRDASSVMRTGAEKFYNDFTQKYAELVPEKIVESLGKRNNSTEIKAVFDAINPQSTAANDVRSAFITRIMEKAYDPKTEIVRGGVIVDELKRLGNSTVNAFLPPGVRDNLERFAQAVNLVQEKQGSGIGRIFAQLKTAGAVTQLGIAGATMLKGGEGPSASDIGEGIAILGLPALFSAIITNPRASRLMLGGIHQIPRGAEHLPPALTKALAIIVNEGTADRQKARKQMIIRPAEGMGESSTGPWPNQLAP